MTVVSRAEVERSPSKTVDELLRAVPSFGVFRRSSSVSADPSSQGVNLRGIGPSGVSRSLVLVDGIPANDPFGGWVYWRQIPRIDIQRIEVAPGGASALYGNYALGGVTQIFSRPITSATGEATVEYGSFASSQVGLRTTDRRGPIGVALDAELLQSHGYSVVAPSQRGAVDGNTPSWDGAVQGRVEAELARDLSLNVRGSYFYEDYNGGTDFTTAAARRFEYGAVARYTPGEAGAFELSLFGHANDFKQLRARVAAVQGASRAAEFLAGSQQVPSHDLGAGLTWTSPPLALAGTHTLTAGADVRRITAVTGEDIFPASPVASAAVVRRDASGKQYLVGAFAQEVYEVAPPLSLELAVRYDAWQNTDASRLERTAGGVTTLKPFAARSDHQVSPKAGLRFRPVDGLTFRAAAYQAFRSPTLNELYRPFQVGAIRTDANENLRPETLKGGEAGFDLAPAPGLSARVTGFWNELYDPISNVTTGLTTRQRQNLGQARIRGVESDVRLRFARFFVASAAYTFADSRVTSAPGQPQLVGRDLAQAPRHKATASLAYDRPGVLSLMVQTRYLGAQYEDDLNTLKMGEALLVDLSVSPRLSSNVDLVLGVENLFDKSYLVGRAGPDTVGQPRFVHGGLRVHFGG